MAKCEGLRSALQAQEVHAEDLERELATRPSTKQVSYCATIITLYTAALHAFLCMWCLHVNLLLRPVQQF